MANIETSYLGLRLKNPLVASSGPLTSHYDSVLRLEDAGVGAVVLRSIFEEQIKADVSGMYKDLEGAESNFALEYLRADLPARLGPEAYLDRIVAIKKRLNIPVIASCNCIEKAQWISYAKKIQQAGADAIELNLYHMPVNPYETSEMVENRKLDMIQSVLKVVKIPVTVKVSYHYTSLLPFARKLDGLGVKGMVLFNRFLQTDVDIHNESMFYAPNYSTPGILHSQLRWAAVLRDWVHADLAISGGIHTGDELIKCLLVGANAGYICSVLHTHPDHGAVVQSILNKLAAWMDTKGYRDLDAFRGKLRETNLSDGKGFERAQYVNAAMSVGMPAKE